MTPELFVQILQLLATVAIAVVVHQSAGSVARIEILRSLRETWINIDSFALSDARTLNIADSLLPPRPPDPPDRSGDSSARKRLFLLAYLNPIATWFDAVEEGIYGAKKEQNMAVVRGLLGVVLRDEDAYWVTQNHWYGDSFEKLCREIHSTLPSKPPDC